MIKRWEIIQLKKNEKTVEIVLTELKNHGYLTEE